MFKINNSLKLNIYEEKIIPFLYTYFTSYCSDSEVVFLKKLKIIMKQKALQNFSLKEKHSAWEFLRNIKNYFNGNENFINSEEKWELTFDSAINYYIDALLELKELAVKEEKRNLCLFIKKLNLNESEVGFILKNKICNNEN